MVKPVQVAMAVLVVPAVPAAQVVPDSEVQVVQVVLASAAQRITFSITREIRKKSRTSSVRRFAMETTPRLIYFSYAHGKRSNPLCQPSSR